MGQSSSSNHSNSRGGSGRSQDRSTAGSSTPQRSRSSNRSNSSSPSYNAQTPLQFHSFHGSNIILSPDGKSARRNGSFCNAIVFTSRPVKCMEKVCIKFTDTTTNWSGVVRFGYTNRNPDEIGSATLPRYACPDLTSRTGFWAKALGETYAERNNVLCFWVNRQGEVLYTINNDNKGIFFNDVDVNEPLWGLMDIYGNSVEVRLVDPPENINDDRSVNESNDMAIPVTSRLVALDLDSDSSQSSISSFLNAQESFITRERNLASIPGLQPLPFHEICGMNVVLDPTRTQARRIDGEFQNSVVFLNRPIHVGELVIIEILETTARYLGCLTIGVTSCDPAVISPAVLPDDCEDFYDRQEYWAISKDISLPDVGDQLSFVINSEGELHYHENAVHQRVLMHVDASQPLWILFEIYGSTQKIKSLGVVPVSSTLRANTQNMASSLSGGFGDVSPQLHRSIGIPGDQDEELSLNLASESGFGASNTTTTSPGSGGGRNTEECVICYDRRVDTVIYTCGHMCLCFLCGKKLKQQVGAVCPICRAVIKDVIKTYRA
ncbi:E3 ubiquitin-protein ligase NEURL1-like [Ptychodera flava]|uniref:E3 ubiquitin-protein ligase NEURL1-like n=1 Tax=Ptychodera flava TaxID=63121 RepID=UPI00396A3539